jgi:hypothetical protein
METKNGFDITKWELLEFSAVAVPANQDAIAEAVKSFGNDFAKGLVSNVSKMESVEKSGRKISAETRAVLDKIKACGDKLDECEKMLKSCGKELKSLLAELDDPEDDTGEGLEVDEDEDEKTIDFDCISHEVEL